VSEHAGFRAFVEARWPALVRFAYALTGDRADAEDVVQQALERCWRRWRHVQMEGAEAYVRTAIARLVISRWRRRRLEETPLGGADLMVGPGPEETIVLHDVLWREMAGLPPRMRAVVVLRFVEDLSEAQTAEILGCSLGTVKSQASRALARLRVQPELLSLAHPPAPGIRGER
jgi:RNA polymerase sigma-70 factor (sigma-E family)